MRASKTKIYIISLKNQIRTLNWRPPSKNTFIYRPRQRWSDKVAKDLRIVRVKNFTEVALNGKKIATQLQWALTALQASGKIIVILQKISIKIK